MAGMRAVPLSPPGLVAHIVMLIASRPAESALRVGIDGAPAADPAALADRLVAPLLGSSRTALRVSTADFLRPASLRWEHGREDPDSYYEDWFDFGALRREVLDPLAPGGSQQYLPALWDPGVDRSPRLPRQSAPPSAVLVVDGPFLLGAGLPFDLTVHLQLSAAALRRRTPPSDHWMLPAYDRYDAEAQPADSADLVVLIDDSRHPALVCRSG